MYTVVSKFENIYNSKIVFLINYFISTNNVLDNYSFLKYLLLGAK